MIVRRGWHQPTRDYLTRQTAEHKTSKEIMSCLKRYLAREIFAVLGQLQGQNLTTAA